MWATAVLLAVLEGAASPAATPTTEQRIEEARQSALTDDYQPTLPHAGTTGGEDGGSSEHKPKDGWRGSEPDDDLLRRHASPPERDTGTVGTVLQYLLWGVLIVVLAIGVIWIGSELLGGKDDAKLEEEEDAEAAPKLDAAVIEKPLGDADEWARQGNYTEAIHTLLLRTLQELVRATETRVAPATTSREILARVPLLADAREALAGLITAVEITHFGGDVASADDYARCREQFNRFAKAVQR